MKKVKIYHLSKILICSIIELILNKRFDNFITGTSNKLAYEASLKVSENISHYNPLYIYGGVGMGKTHLLNSIGLSLKDKNKVMLISAERFMYQFVKSIKV